MWPFQAHVDVACEQVCSEVPPTNLPLAVAACTHAAGLVVCDMWGTLPSEKEGVGPGWKGRDI